MVKKSKSKEKPISPINGLRNKSTIEWTHFPNYIGATLNLFTGCKEISSECKNCYARTYTENYQHRFSEYWGPDYVFYHGFKPAFHAHVFEKANIKRPHAFFVNGFSDTFHDFFTFEQILKIFMLAVDNPQHIFIILTKRIERCLQLAADLPWPNNLILGVTAGCKKSLYRIDMLRDTPAATKMVSAEPLLEDLGKINLNGIGWLIAGGESGDEDKIRPMDPKWFRSLRDQSQSENVPFFAKQWGSFASDMVTYSYHKTANGSLIDGVDYKEFPKIPGILFN
jgi:protein gp37